MHRHTAVVVLAVTTALTATACQATGTIPVAAGLPSDLAATGLPSATPSTATPSADPVPLDPGFPNPTPTGTPSGDAPAGATAGPGSPAPGTPLPSGSGLTPAVSTAVMTAAGHAATPLAPCAPGRLRWTLTLLAGPATGDRPTARLTAVNSSPAACVFGGYPWFRVHLGKGPEVLARPGSRPAQSLTVAPGHAVDTLLSYSELPDPIFGCVMPAGARPQAQALPPGAAPTATRIAVPMTDPQGRPAPLAVCGTSIQMAPPTLR